MNNLQPIEIAKNLSNISSIDIFNKSRKREVIETRSLFFYILNKHFFMGWTQISKFFAENGSTINHATIIHSVKNYPVYRKNNERLIELEKMFIIENDSFGDEKTAMMNLSHENEMLKFEITKLKQQSNPLINKIKTIPEHRWDVVLDKLELMIKSWEWKDNYTPTPTTMIDCSQKFDAF
jgi:hypothetical protein